MTRAKDVKNFIDKIPDSKLTGLPRQGGTLFSDDTFRFDMQGMTSDNPPFHNLHVQVNKNPKISSFKKYAPDTIADIRVPSGELEWTAEQVRTALKATIEL